jgi:hypothetical protein
VLSAYGKGLVGPAPQFPVGMEQRIDVYLKGDSVETTVGTNAPPAPMPEALPFLPRMERVMLPAEPSGGLRQLRP